MNLDDISSFRKLDSQNMLAEIDALPNQLQSAWEFGSSYSLPAWSDIRQVLIAGMGGSAIGADLLSAYIAPQCTVPVMVHRDYGLPVWAKGSHTLIIASSHSGNTEETLSSFDQALTNGCRCLAISTGGKLASAAGQVGLPVWRFQHQGQPRAAVGFSFGLLLAAFVKLGLLADPAKVSSEVESALAAMRFQQEMLRAEIPTVQNPAKRQAGQLVGRWVSVFASGVLAPVARRWKGQISELAKAWAQFEYLPEANHNTLAGAENPEELLGRMAALFLSAPCDHPRNHLRSELTRQIFMQQGLATDVYEAKGDTPLANLWTTLQFGDYLAYYLAIAYEMDPTPIPAIMILKEGMSSR